MRNQVSSNFTSGDSTGVQRGTVLLEGMETKGRVQADRFTPASETERKLIVSRLSNGDVETALFDLGRLRVNATGAKFIDGQAFTAVDPRESLVRNLQWSPQYLTEQIVTKNLITQVGDQYYGERASGISSPPGQVTGMKLGTGSTAVAKTSTGAALVTYLSGSQKAIDGSFPTSSLSGASRQIQWKTSWGAGVINGSALREVVIVIDVLADATSSAANTISRALFGPMTLGSLDTLAITWNHLLLGA